MVFLLGVMPYISVLIIFSLLVKVIPSLEKLSKEGASGQKKINRYTRYATVPICIVQALLVIVGVFQGQMQGKLVDPEITGFWYFLWVLMAITAFTAGTLFIMWLGEQITEHGVGNGVSLIIMAGIIAQVPGSLIEFVSNSAIERNDRITSGFTLALLFVAIVFVVVYITKGQRRIPIQQAKLTRGRRVYGGQRHYLPLKVNQAGVMQIIFASALMVLPSMLGAVPGLGFMQEAFAYGSFWNTIAQIVMILFFSFFWTSLMFQPSEMANNLKEYGSFIPGIRPGKRTAEYLEKVMVRITLAGGTFLALIAVLPQFITTGVFRGTSLPSQVVFFLGGTSILITVSVALDLVDKLNSHLLMRNYDGFMGSTSGSMSRRSRRR
ncbi:MAG: preprotein translocase subunit SecY [Planctomycetota bacterium]